MVRPLEEEGWRPMRAAEAASVSVRTLSRWLRCYRRDGEEGLLDRFSVPRLISHRTPEERLGAIAALRWLRLRAAQALSMPRSTVSTVLSGEALPARAGRAR